MNLANSRSFKLRKRFDPTIPTVALVLSLFGLVMVLSASQISAADKFGNAYYYFIRQFISWGLGVGVFFYYLRTPMEKLFEQRSIYLIVTVVMLIGVLIFGPRIAAVHRWIDLGFFRFQPAEFAKLFLIIYFSGWFAAKGDKIKSALHGLLPFLAILTAMAGLIILEPDMGTMLIVVIISMAMFFIAQANLAQYFGIIMAGIVCLVLLIYAAPYRAERLTSFLNAKNGTHDVLGSAYHNQQALIAIGSGGLWGVGFGQGTSKYSYLPQSHTDSIFAVIAEELGFVRSAGLILAYLYIAWRSYVISRRANSRFVQLLSAGVGIAIVGQALINIGGLLHIIPLTGVPLPFISYGGSSMVVSMAMIGLLTNASREVNE